MLFSTRRLLSSFIAVFFVLWPFPNMMDAISWKLRIRERLLPFPTVSFSSIQSKFPSSRPGCVRIQHVQCHPLLFATRAVLKYRRLQWGRSRFHLSLRPPRGRLRARAKQRESTTMKPWTTKQKWNWPEFCYPQIVWEGPGNRRLEATPNQPVDM